VGLDEPRERFLKCVEAALQPLDEQDFHEGGDVALALHGALLNRAGVVLGVERLVSRVVEIGAGDGLQRVGEDGALRAVEQVEQRHGIADLREPNLLLLEVVAIELLNLAARAPHHGVFEHPLAQLVGILLDRGHVILGVVEPVQSFEAIP